MLLDEALTRTVIGRFYTVYNRMGYGFPENPYVGALEHECAKAGLRVEREVAVAVYYDGLIVGSYRVDLLIEARLILEVKAAAKVLDEHVAQLLNYLRCTDIELGLLFNFGPKPAFKRCIFRNSLKQHIERTSLASGCLTRKRADETERAADNHLDQHVRQSH